MTLAEENHCLRCGALLPEGDEGMCPSCGTPFGKATQAMKVDQDRLRELAEQRRAQKAAAEAPAPGPAASAAKEAPKTILFIVVALIVLLLLAVAYLVVM